MRDNNSQRTQKPVAVLAGTREQFEAWLRETGRTEGRDAVYVRDRETVQRYEFSAIEYIGTWGSLRNLYDLERQIRARIR